MRTAIRVLCSLLLLAQAWAGVTGKITGQVKDSQGAPLIGVNVVLLGQSRGGATDLDGEYRILNVPPGEYSLQFTCVGYRSVRLDNVRVSVDLTAHHNAVLKESALEGESVSVVAQRAIVQVDQTYSASYVDAKQLKSMPVTELSQVVSLQAGVVDGHFRGGRSGEVLYLVDGIPVTDVYDGSKGVDVQVSMVQELQVLSGTFNAEYGQAMSGVVNTVTRDAGDKPDVSVSGWLGDYVSNHSKQFYDIEELDPFNLSNVEVGFSSPTPLPWLSLNGSLRYSDNNGWQKGRRLFSPQEVIGAWDVDGVPYRFYRADEVIGFTSTDLFGGHFFVMDQAADSAVTAVIQAGHWPMLDADDSLAVGEMLDWADERSLQQFETASGDGEGVNMDVEVKRSAQLKLRANLGPGSVLRAMWLGSDRDYKEYTHSWRYTPDGRLRRYSRSQLLSLKWDKVLGPDMFMDLSLSQSLNTYHHRLYDNIMDSRYRSDEWFPAESGFFYYSFDELDPFHPVTRDDDVYVGYAQMGSTENEHFERRTDTWDLKGNLSKQWGKRHMWKAGFESRNHRLFYSQRSVSFNGYEIVAPQGANNNRYTRYPWEAAGYLQDKIEFSDVTVNAGVRLDVFNANTSQPADLRDPTNSLLGREDVKAKWQVSPRLAIAYVVSESGVLHFSYGHFFQRPSFDVLYQNPDFELTGLNTIVGNPDLDVEKTVQYEIGLQQKLGEDVAVELSFYSRDIRDLVSTDLQIETVTVDKYYMYTNRDFGNIKGFVLSLDKRYLGGFSAGLDYTFQVAEANASSADAARNAVEAGKEVNKYLIPLNWDRRHTLNGYVSLDRGGLWGLSLLGSYGSGLPYTPTPKSEDLVVGLLENSGRKPTYINFDMSGYWNVLKKPDLQVNFQVKNLLDRLNENNVFARTGRAGYDVDWQDTQSELVVDPGNYSRPREVILGFRLSL